MKADKLDYTDKTVIIDRLFAVYEGYEAEEIKEFKPTTIYEEQEINQLVGLQASIITMLNQFIIWRGVISQLEPSIAFYRNHLTKTDNSAKIAYYKKLTQANNIIIRIYKEIVVLKHLILALQTALRLAYGKQTTVEMEEEIKKIQDYCTNYNQLADEVLSFITNDEKIETEKIILKKPVYKKDLGHFMDRAENIELYNQSYITLVDGLMDYVNVEITTYGKEKQQ